MLATLSAAERVPDFTACYLSVIPAGHTEHRSKCMHRIERIPQGESPRVTDTTVRRQKHHAVAMLGCNLVQDVLPLDPPAASPGRSQTADGDACAALATGTGNEAPPTSLT